MLAARTSTGMLQDDGLNDVGGVLSAVRRPLEEPVDLPPLDDLDGVLLVGEQLADRFGRHLVGHVLEPVELDGQRQQLAQL